MPSIGVRKNTRDSNLITFRLREDALDKLDAIKGKRSLGACCQDILYDFLNIDTTEEVAKKRDFKQILGDIVEDKLIRVLAPQMTKLRDEVHHLRNEQFQLKVKVHLLENPNLEYVNGTIREKIKDVNSVNESVIQDAVDNVDKSGVQQNGKKPRKPRIKKEVAVTYEEQNTNGRTNQN